MTQKMTNKMTILQVSKIAFFSKHCHLFSVSFIFRQIFDIFPFFVRQWHQNDKKKPNFPPNDQKKGQNK